MGGSPWTRRTPISSSSQPPRARSTVSQWDSGQRWQEAQAPLRKGTHVLTLLTHDADLGVVYAVAHKGALYRSADAGSRWKPVVPVTESWPRRRVRGAVAAA